MKMARIKKIIDAARREDWDFVDKEIPVICNHKAAQDEAVRLLKSKDGNLRDLGASILGMAHIEARRYLAIKPVLSNVMRNDSNPYARYRAAFALAEHGVGSYKREVVEVLNEAVRDPAVAEIAKKYLKRLKKES